MTELRQGFFHLFLNTPKPQNYVGPLLDRQVYNPDCISTKMRTEFNRWYEQQLERQRTSDYRFNFQEELLVYCRSDVRFLKEGFLCFKFVFQDLAHYNHFRKIIIASACRWNLRRNRLKTSDRLETLYPSSEIAIGRLLWEQHQQGIQIQHACNKGEYIVSGTHYIVDEFTNFMAVFIKVVLDATKTATPPKKPPKPYYG